MAKTVQEIRAQIAKLQQQEQSALQKEAVEVVARIKEAVAYYGLTPDQIFGPGDAAQPSARKSAGARKPAKASKAKKPKAAKPTVAAASTEATAAKATNSTKGQKIAAKYKDEAGNTWSGRGSQPRWIRAALESGKKVEDFLIS